MTKQQKKYLTEEDIEDLKRQGFTEQQIQQAVEEMQLQDSYKQEVETMDDGEEEGQQSVFQTKNHDDLARWQLELNDILERAEHILRGDEVTIKNGRRQWSRIDNDDENPLNEFGVRRILTILCLYINRNTILSDYRREEINDIVYDFGVTLNNLIFKKYEEFGMDTENKRKEYEMIVLKLTHLVMSAYHRALEGGERRSLREMINVQQRSQMLAQGGVTLSQQGNPVQKRSIVNPMRYIKGKYKEGGR